MNQDELDSLPDVTPQIFSEERIIDGRRVIVPVYQPEHGALFHGPDDGHVVCAKTGQVYFVGWLNDVRVKRVSPFWSSRA